MKFTQLTKRDIWRVYTKFQMNQLTLVDVQNLKIPQYLTFSRSSTLKLFMHNCKYFVYYSMIEFIFIIYSHYFLYGNTGV